MLHDTLKRIVGDSGWIDDPDLLEPHLTEWRGRFRGNSRLMVLPNSVAQIAEVVRACAKAGTAVVPQGGNTGLCGGAIPDESGDQVLLSLSRLNAIRSIDPDNFSITVEAGCVLADVQQAARDVDRMFPLSLGAEGSCQIGGNLATNAGGINVLRYGSARQQVLGLEVVLADGTVWNGLRSLRKDNAGYDLKQLFLGSEGTLGVITAATMKLYPDPGQTVTLFLALPKAHSAVDLLGRMQERFPDRIQSFELISARCLRLVRRHIADAAPPFETEQPWYILTEIVAGEADPDIEDALAAALEDGAISDAIFAKNVSEAERLWRLRLTISEAQKPEGVSLKHDVSIPIGRMAEFLARGDALLASMAPDARLVAFGHVGDGNLHYNISQPADADPARFRRKGKLLTAAIYDLVDELGGSFSAEHGIGVVKKAQLRQYRGGAEIDMMRVLKNALDPQNILNPGKVI